MATYVGLDVTDATGEVSAVSVVVLGTGPTPTIAEVLIAAGAGGCEFTETRERFGLDELAFVLFRLFEP